MRFLEPQPPLIPPRKTTMGAAPIAQSCTCMYGGYRQAENTRRLTCQAPAACTGRRKRSWRWRRSGSPATEPSGPVTKLDPLDHLQPIPAAHWTHRGLGGVKLPPCCLPDRVGDPIPNRCVCIVCLSRSTGPARIICTRALQRHAASGKRTAHHWCA